MSEEITERDDLIGASPDDDEGMARINNTLRLIKQLSAEKSSVDGSFYRQQLELQEAAKRLIEPIETQIDELRRVVSNAVRSHHVQTGDSTKGATWPLLGGHLAVRLVPPMVEVSDQKAVVARLQKEKRDDLLNEKVSVSVDKKAVLALFRKTGEEVEGCRVVKPEDRAADGLKFEIVMDGVKLDDMGHWDDETEGNPE